MLGSERGRTIQALRRTHHEACTCRRRHIEMEILMQKQSGVSAGDSRQEKEGLGDHD